MTVIKKIKDSLTLFFYSVYFHFMQGAWILKDKINKLTERHKARLCDKLREARIPEIALDAVRKEFDYLKEDILNFMQGAEHGNKKE